MKKFFIAVLMLMLTVACACAEENPANDEGGAASAPAATPAPTEPTQN